MPSPDEEAPLAPAEWFARFLDELPPLVDLGESAPHGATPAANIDPASLALHHRVLRHMEANPGVDYAEALTACADR